MAMGYGTKHVCEKGCEGEMEGPLKEGSTMHKCSFLTEGTVLLTFSKICLQINEPTITWTG